MHEKPATTHRTRERAGRQEIARHAFDVELTQRAQRMVSRTRASLECCVALLECYVAFLERSSPLADEGAHAVARCNQRACDMTTDEACGPGQKDEVT